MIIIEDERHCEWIDGEFPTLAEAWAELERRAGLPWNEAPNRAPCTGWRTCGRRYVIIEFGTSVEPWRRLRSLTALNVLPQGVIWLLARPDA